MHVASYRAPCYSLSHSHYVCIGNLVIELSYLVELRWAAHGFSDKLLDCMRTNGQQFGTNMLANNADSSRMVGETQLNGRRYGKYVNNLLGASVWTLRAARQNFN